MKRFILLLVLLTTTSVFAQKTAKAVYSDGTLSFYYDSDTHSGTVYDVSVSGTPTWSEQKANVTKVVFDDGFKDFAPTSLADWFYKFQTLTTVEGLQNLNTANVASMSQMFRYCSELQQLDLCTFNTSNDTTFYAMFDGCKKLRSINFDSFDTSKVNTMMSMFSSCESLQSLDLSSFDTQLVCDMRWMFQGCKTLEYLDLTNFDTNNVTDMSLMFKNDENLSRIFVSDAFSVSTVSNSKDMFTGCAKLSGAMAYDSKKVTAAYANYATGYFTYSCTSVVYLNSKGYATYSSDMDLKIGEGADAYTAEVEDGEISCTSIAKIPAASGVLLYGVPGSYVTFKPGTSGNLRHNQLLPTTLADGSLAAIPTTGYTFVLSGDKFMKYSASSFSPRKAYFNLSYDPTASSSGASMRIVFDGLDHITATPTDAQEAPAAVFDINGKPAHTGTGLRIVNGRLQFRK